MAGKESDSLVQAANEYFDALIKSRFVEMFEGADQVPLSHYISSLIAGKSLAGSEECVNKVLKTGSVTFGHFNSDEVKNLPIDYVPDSKHLVRQGDVLISRMNTAELVGAVAYVDVSMQDTYLPDRLWRADLKANANGIFIWQALSDASSKSQIRRLASGTSGSMKNISKLQMLSITVPLVPLNLQNQFADFVKQVDKSKLLFQQMVSRFDELVKSRFVEMFGDPVYNPLGWPNIELGQITSKIGSGATPKGGKASYVGNEISFIRSMNVHDASFDYSELAYITNSQAELLSNVEVESDDILFNITGASVARCCIVPDDVLPARVNQHVSIIRLDQKSMNPIFCMELLIFDSMKNKLINDSKSKGSTREAITKDMLRRLHLIMPPLELQNQFADFVKQVDKSKSEILEGIKRLKMPQNN